MDFTNLFIAPDKPSAINVFQVSPTGVSREAEAGKTSGRALSTPSCNVFTCGLEMMARLSSCHLSWLLYTQLGQVVPGCLGGQATRSAATWSSYDSCDLDVSRAQGAPTPCALAMALRSMQERSMWLSYIDVSPLNTGLARSCRRGLCCVRTERSILYVDLSTYLCGTSCHSGNPRQ